MEVNLLIAAISGFIGALILTLLIYLLKLFGQDLDIPYLIGTQFVDIQNKTKVYVVGILLHLLIGAGWGVLYVVLLTAMVVTPNWPAGILWGFGHGIFVGAMIGIIADTHPYIGEDKPINSPGILGREWGTLMPYWILGIHIIFGVCTLSIYHWWLTG
ncbi:hypothetical protein CK503_12225 [Aliifodinibius salipaludis]|uniref:DUF2938 domain-containing protein n=1 Tax=Fodinibius salipaludis TaxID=2032627 RepID=A0A2A2G782_9BACT|nr:hypothetical protein [Aliifodinibius salipaludis]PAU93491.1 hypothetical protein CK503_12225 [Aliifodinibius salipaludis]